MTLPKRRDEGGTLGRKMGYLLRVTLICNCQGLSLCFCFQIDKTHCVNRKLQITDIGHS